MRSTFPESTHEQFTEHLSVCACFISLNVTTQSPSRCFSKDKISFFGWILFCGVTNILVFCFLCCNQLVFLFLFLLFPLLQIVLYPLPTACLLAGIFTEKVQSICDIQGLWEQRINKSQTQSSFSHYFGRKNTLSFLWNFNHQQPRM